MKIYPLQKGKQKPNNKIIFGFDIETTGRKNKFYCASIYSDVYKPLTFFDKQDLIDHFKKKRFRNAIVSATNLSFDFMGTFFGTEEIKNFSFVFRGSDLLYCKSYIHDKKFVRKDVSNQMAITFIDTLNYAKLSVENLGELINIKKLKKPACLGRMPDNEKEKEELVIYNMRDSEISAKALEFFYDTFYNLGASSCNTIASTSMSLFRNKYLKTSYFRHDTDTLLDLFNGYYGGRTEAFARGEFKNYKLYDVNSLYPSVMCKEFPDPNTLRLTYKGKINYVYGFEGMSLVDIDAPIMDYPLLPYRYDLKLLFPYGTFTGWYTHVELRKAIDMGYKITKIKKTYYYTKTCRPFNDFVNDLYSFRMKNRSSSMGYVAKLLMNSLYGKFGQKFIDRDEWLSADITMDELNKHDDIERVGDFFRVKRSMTNPSVFCFPIWCSYVTAYGRIMLTETLKKYGGIYCDTDSIITKNTMISSGEIGRWKLENNIRKGHIIKPKFYGFIDENGKKKIRIKGVGFNVNYDDFKKILVNPKVKYDKFIKFKESLRRKLSPNEIIDMEKMMSLEDDKRDWSGNMFNKDEFALSRPLKMKKGKLYKDINILNIQYGKAKEKMLTM